MGLSDAYSDISARVGPGYTWQFTTPNQTNPAEYTDASGNRVFYLKASAGYVRSVTLKITKSSASSVNPTFRIYGRQGQCLTLSTPTVSSGTYTTTTFVHDIFNPNATTYSGYSWTPTLGASALNATATFTFNVATPGTSCVEGFVDADMTSPTTINSAGNYWDEDSMYFVEKSTL